MSVAFGAEFHGGNRRRLMDATSANVVIITAASMLQKTTDENFPFRQDSSFWYLTGIDVPDAVLVMVKNPAQEFVLLPLRAQHRDQWEGSIDTKKLSHDSGIAEMLDYREGWARVKQLLTGAKTVGTLLPPGRRFYYFYGMRPNPARSRLVGVLKRARPGIKIETVAKELKDLRIIKQEPEIDALRKAIAVTEDALRKVQSAMPLQFEYEAEALLHLAIRRDGFEGVGFDTVTAAGSNAATIHYRENNQPVADTDMLLMDCGARYGYYSADISRVFAPKKGLSKRQKEVVEAVREVKKFAETHLQIGVGHMDYEQQVENYMGEQLVKLGVLQQITKEGVRQYFPSLTSHHLGLDVHDVMDRDEIFAPNMVLTIEPGIYLPDENIGVRFEDDYLITPQGLENLSPNLPDVLE